MEPLIVIFSFILIISSLAFGLGGRIHKRQLEYKERKDALDRENVAANPAGAAKKIEHLEQRVRVLERLATDRGQDLAQQIEQLREHSGEALQFEKREKVQ